MFAGKNPYLILGLVILILTGCANNRSIDATLQPALETAPRFTEAPTAELPEYSPTPEPAIGSATATADEDFPDASVVSVTVSGSPESYQFQVGIASPDTGCDQYADWWEVLSEDGKLIYRRILLHSHVNEQPFVRSGGPVKIDADIPVIIRVHMNTTGYGQQAMKGTASDGFEPIDLPHDLWLDLATQPPLPSGCNF